MENLHNDRSFIEPEKAKSASEGAGQLLAAIGKEIDEHDVAGKIGNAYAFSQKASSIAIILIALAMIVFLVIFGMRSMNFFGNNSNSSRTEIREGDNKRTLVVDGVKEYQLKDKDGLWYRVDESEYNLK